MHGPGQGAGYEYWAKLYNLKQMVAALQFLQENGLTDYDALAAKTETVVEWAHTLAGELRAVEDRLARTSALMGAVVDYAKTRPVFDGYKAARYSKKYLAEHEEELDTYRAAKASINEILDGAKLPRMEKLKQERRELSEKRRLSVPNTGGPAGYTGVRHRQGERGSSARRDWRTRR